jgi:hypothetical protein
MVRCTGFGDEVSFHAELRELRNYGDRIRIGELREHDINCINNTPPISPYPARKPRTATGFFRFAYAPLQKAEAVPVLLCPHFFSGAAGASTLSTFAASRSFST